MLAGCCLPGYCKLLYRCSHKFPLFYLRWRKQQGASHQWFSQILWLWALRKSFACLYTSWTWVCLCFWRYLWSLLYPGCYGVRRGTYYLIASLRATFGFFFILSNWMFDIWSSRYPGIIRLLEISSSWLLSLKGYGWTYPDCWMRRHSSSVIGWRLTIAPSSDTKGRWEG